MKIIYLYIVGDTWIAEFFNDPEIEEIMGSNIIPTAFSSKTDGVTVGERMLACNPGADVRVIL